MEQLLTVKEAAEITRLNPKTLYAYAERRIIPHIKLGSRLFFTEKQLEKWILDSTVASIDEQLSSKGIKLLNRKEGSNR
ncbi:MAG: helix-turn-helix domain-containing protein [Desulfobacteraceae bacterium]|nr:helix-turn-helix domain-containing protein [Desulfobacteraceae bacterium]